MMLNPKSYAAVSKASVVSAAPPQPAAVPKPKLSTAPSMMSTDLKPSVTASKLAVNTTSLKVKIHVLRPYLKFWRSFFLSLLAYS